jgi:DNA-binding SARP family transcriptional activator
MRFRVLGPLQVRTDKGELVGLGAAKHRALLSMLLLYANQLVPTDRLIDALWPDRQPRSARAILRTYVAAVRAAVPLDRGPGVVSLVCRPGGYQLNLPPEELDLLVFGDLAKQGERAQADGDLTLAVERLHGALALWRGKVVEDVALDGPVLSTIAALDERRIAVHEAWIETRLALGYHAGVLAELRALVAENPLRERLSALLMLALYRAGRQAEALTVFATTRRLLVDELGIEPGAELQRVHADILNSRDPDPAATGTRPADHVVPRELPPAVRHLAGRTAELAALTALAEDSSGAGTVAIAAIDGMAGVGKTSLAVYWAHRAADRFPDGQLYVNLRGFGPAEPAMEPADAVRGFLDALAVPPGRIPVSLHAQVALYRSLVSGRRMLVVLDNARDADQVRPLLPSSSGCMAVVTSRSRFAGLLATDGAEPFTLHPLTEDESRDLLSHHIDVQRLAGEPHAVDDIISSCGRLPLTLAMAAARAATQPGFPLRALADELHAARGSLDAFEAGDSQTDVRVAFSSSYRSLDPEAARVFRLLALHPGPDIAVAAAASLTGTTMDAVRPVLSTLARAHLIEECAPGRFALHDLLRAYAARLTHETDTEPVRRAAVHRMLDHYLHTGYAADRLLDPHQDPITPDPPQPGVTLACPADHGSALAWFAAEVAGLLAVLSQAAGGGFDTHAWQLAGTVSTFLEFRGRWQDWVGVQLTALGAAQHQGDRRGQARAHRGLVGAYTRLARCDDADVHLHAAFGLFEELGDRVGQGYTHLSLSRLFERQGRYRPALDHALRARDLLRDAGNAAAHARAVNTVGWYHALLGEHERALTHCQEALARLRDLDDRRGQAHAWDRLGYIHHHLGRHPEAGACYQHALELFQEAGDRYHEAVVLTHLGGNHQGTGNHRAAREAFRRAFAILAELGHPDADPAKCAIAGKAAMSGAESGPTATRPLLDGVAL